MQNMTNMRLAFQGRTTRPTASAAVENMVARHLLHSKAGLLRDQRPNAALSFKMSKLIEMPECANPHAMQKVRGLGWVPNTRFDRMCRGEEASA